MKCSIVILNWNGLKMLREYLPSVVKHSDRPDCEVVVADNGSSDNSVDFVEKEFPEVRLIRLRHNYGFAEGYNRAIQQLKESEYVVLLNSDVEVTEGWLQPVLDYMDAHPEVAAAQPKIRSLRQRECFEHAGAAGGYLDRLGYPFCRGRILGDVEEDKGQYDIHRPLEDSVSRAPAFDIRFFFLVSGVLFHNSSCFYYLLLNLK
ncbi:MAG: glycosyltransferase family 2 protein, partial [Paludibacteraceae bacterium]|nr:glycosyltransferase family 2 protein [Paludibacteraceae bacterium]